MSIALTSQGLEILGHGGIWNSGHGIGDHVRWLRGSLAECCSPDVTKAE